MIEINGVAHVIINVGLWEKSCTFYRNLLVFMGLSEVFTGKEMLYFVGGRTALGINRVSRELENQRFNQQNIGLHHLCWRARSKKDVDILYNHLLANKAKIIHPPEEGAWAPGYYSVLFEDPAGTRLELNYVPGEGVLADGVNFNPANDYK